MSAELYDAEMAGALARPAIDVLPTHHARKDKAAETVADAAARIGEADAEVIPELVAIEASAAPVDAQAVADVLPAAETADEASHTRKVFGLSLSRGRRAKPQEEVAVEDLTVADTEHDEPADLPALEPVAEFAPALEGTDAVAEDPAAPAEPIVALAPSLPDHTDEVRAMHALLEASEQVRQAAEARTAAAEAELRTVTNSVQEWQIRHREAEATITELAASLAGAEGRMAELHQQLSAVAAERDELHSQLDAVTSPTAG